MVLKVVFQNRLAPLIDISGKFADNCYKIVHCFDLGQDVSTGQIVDHEGVGIKHVTGVGILDNHSVNLLSSLLTAVFVPCFAVSVWDGL